ncbi:MAG: alpha-1,2-fucosyltransferase [Oscillospiraceae bacterium]|nr:alpha-1,2-fucosyltransferase [Oscillospiraceae bacterium]
MNFKKLNLKNFSKSLKITLIIAFGIFLIVFGIFIIYKKTKRTQSYKIVQIMGGLGNQLFQYAFGVALRKKLNCDVFYEKNFFDNQVRSENGSCYRNYGLGFYNTHIKFANENQIENCFKIPEEELRKHDILYFKNNKNEHLLGYFQKVNYFEDFRIELLKDLKLKIPLDKKNKTMMKMIEKTKSVSVHIRRTDYLNFKDTFEIPGLESYYYPAMEKIAQIIHDPTFYIFTDSIDWVKENFKTSYKYFIVDINDDSKNYFDLELMRKCKHNIIANSTFSWWGAWLNTNEDKIVISPKVWFVNNDFGDIIPKSWIRM